MGALVKSNQSCYGNQRNHWQTHARAKLCGNAGDDVVMQRSVTTVQKLLKRRDLVVLRDFNV
jgi:hypothetical protein|tara:strand:+ start:197 stop:382 length:186 start_codon:yes stop_codon:yes gene_type:complete